MIFDISCTAFPEEPIQMYKQVNIMYEAFSVPNPHKIIAAILSVVLT